MAGKLITKVQQLHLARVLTGLVATLDEAHGGKWSKKTTEDIKLAYQMLGVPCPFETANVEPEPPPKPGFGARVKAAMGIG